MAGPRGVPDVPMLDVRKITDNKGVTHNVIADSPQLRRFFMDVREQLLQTRNRLAVPDAPTNFKATAQAFSVYLAWTTSADADYYEVLVSPSASTKDVNMRTVDVGNSGRWVDNVGNSGVQRWYWVRARKLSGGISTETGPVTATTLAAATGSAQPAPPPAGAVLVQDQNVANRLVPKGVNTSARK